MQVSLESARARDHEILDKLGRVQQATVGPRELKNLWNEILTTNSLDIIVTINVLMFIFIIVDICGL